MSMEPKVSQQVKPANKCLWAIKCYLDLISREAPLIPGSGIKRLYVMSSGIADTSREDVDAIIRKSERLKLLPQNLFVFMNQCIVKNCEMYGRQLQALITDRVMAISNGDLENPRPLFKFSSEEARRYYYLPTINFIKDIQKAVAEDFIGDHTSTRGHYPITKTIQDVANEGDYILAQMQGFEGHEFPNASSFGAMMSCVDGLITTLERESVANEPNYKLRSRGALKILWIIAKMIMGDLTVIPERKDLNEVDLQGRINLSDGTLAALPYPTKQVVSEFADDKVLGLSVKGRMYLSAVSGAQFYKNENRMDSERG